MERTNIQQTLPAILDEESMVIIFLRLAPGNGARYGTRMYQGAKK